MIISHIEPVDSDVVLEDIGNPVSDIDDPLPIDSVLERRSLLGPVAGIQQRKFDVREDAFDNVGSKPLLEEFLTKAGTPRITLEGEPIEEEWQVHKILRSEEVTRKIIQSDDHLSYTPERDEDERTEYVEMLEAKREEYGDIADTDEERRRQLIIESFRNDVLPGLFHTAKQFPFDIDISTIIARDTALNGFHDFFMQFPTYYTHLDLIIGRDFHRNRDIEANDLNDVMALAVAIPYTDIVVTEQFFAGVAHQQDLPKRFDTIIRTDLQDLAEQLTDS